MKESSTPLNSPSLTFALVGPRQSSPTFCQSASVGAPLPTPGICKICARRLSCASARFGKRTERAGRTEGRGADRAFENSAPVRSHAGMLIVLLLFHDETSLFF